MSLDHSGISWTNGTLNSLYGCLACSSGCRLCYAMRRVMRFAASKATNPDGRFDGLVDANGRFTGTILFNPDHLYKALRDAEPKMIFVNEFSDLFFEALPAKLILEHMRVFIAANWHHFQVLSKRAARLAEVDRAVLAEFGAWPSNVWIGVSICSASPIEMRKLEQFGAISATVKWISFEPWISDVNVPVSVSVPDLRDRLKVAGITWVVVGGESGSKDDTNLMTLADARYLLAESKAAGCKVHFKQLGTALAIQLSVYGVDEHRSKGGNPAQWPVDLNVREYPDVEWFPYKQPPDFKPLYQLGKWERFEGGIKKPEPVSINPIQAELTPA